MHHTRRYSVAAATALAVLLAGPVSRADSPTPTLTPSPLPSTAGPAVTPPAQLTTPTTSTSTGPSPIYPPLLATQPALDAVDVNLPASLTAATRRAVHRDLSDTALGGSVHALVVAAGSGKTWYARDPDTAGMPASSLKLLTATAALRLLGPDARLTTSVVQPRSGTVVLVGGGDSTLVRAASPSPVPGYWAPATLRDLAKQTAASLHARGVGSVRLGFDASLFRGPTQAASWLPEYVTTGVIAPVTALMVDQGLLHPGTSSPARASDPPQQAADQFAQLLRQDGITVRGAVTAMAVRHGPALAQVQSPPVSWLVSEMLTNSDNQLAEALGRLVAIAAGRPATFGGAAATLEQVAATVASPRAREGMRLFDASGLSREDRMSVRLLIGVLRHAVTDPAARGVIEGLPVAGMTGTLSDRFTEPSARGASGDVRAKTGTLTGVSALVGLVTDSTGALLAFAFVSDSAQGPAAAAALDAAASRLAN